MSRVVEAILIVDDDPAYRQALNEALEREFEVTVAGSADEAQEKINQGLAAVLLDVRLKDEGTANRDGLILLESIKQVQPNLPVVMMTNYGDIDIAVEAMRLGAEDFIQKSRLDVREFRKVLRNAIERSKLERKVAAQDEELRRLKPWDLVGDDPKIQEVRKLVDIVAEDGYSSVLVRGETGSGKEVVAKAVHSRGWRSNGPFVAVSLPALSRELIESELFGHARGAFTDAKATRVGYFEKAHGGVLFLDEIGELPPALQVKLLRFLETKTFARIGSTDEITVDIQVVAATNLNLEQAIKQGQFRDDLYFRLKAMEIRLPSLKDRPDDIPLLSDYFLSNFRQIGRTKIVGISPAALELFGKYSFPGNVRELMRIIESAMMVGSNNGHTLIEPADLPLEVQQGAQPPTKALTLPLGEAGINLDAELARIELAYIQEALQLTEGRKTEAWRILGLNDRFALRRRVKRIGEAYPHLINYFALVQKLYYE
jgi:DNA-binding NtrC family response regulator